jgi:WD40 repeat protein
MTEEDNSSQDRIIPAGDSRLAIQKVLRRGIVDFRRSLLKLPSWRFSRAFTLHQECLAVSPTGQIAASSKGSGQAGQLVELYGAEPLGIKSTISAPAIGESTFADPADSLVWSPTGRYLVTSSGNLRIFDARARRFLQCFGKHQGAAYHLAWSRSGKYLASASGGFDSRSLRLWGCSGFQSLATDEPKPPLGTEQQVVGLVGLNLVGEVASVRHLDDLGFDDVMNEFEGFFGFGCVEFSPDDNFLAAVAIVRTGTEIRWSHRDDDRVIIYGVPGLQEEASIEAYGQAIDLSWAANSQYIVCCCLDRRTYQINPLSAESSRLPFEADMCRCHPLENVCAFALGRGNHYMRNYDSYFAELHEKGTRHRIYIADLDNQSVIDEQTGSGAVVDMRWSSDGKKLYAVTEDGLAYVYEFSRA